MDADDYRWVSGAKGSTYPLQMWVVLLTTFISMLVLFYCCISNHSRRRRLWSNVNVNPARPAVLWSNVDANPAPPGGLWSNADANPAPRGGLWSNVDANPARPGGLWSNVDANPARSGGLWSNVIVNPSRPVLPTAPPLLQENFRTVIDDSEGRTPVDDGDVPPDYTTVVEQRNMATGVSDNLNRYPKVGGSRKSESPPPDYMAVAPFK